MKSPVIKLACSDLQHTRTGDRLVEGEVARYNSGDQAIGDRQNKHIAEDEGGADYEAAGETTGKMYESTLTRQFQYRLRSQVSYALGSTMHK